MITIARMARKRSKPVYVDRHRPGSTVRIPQGLVDRLDRLAALRLTNRQQEVIAAVREYLERAKLWPPSTQEQS